MRNGYLEDLTPERLDSVLDVHIRGSFFVTQAAWPTMRARGYGRVVMTGSAAGMFSQQGVSNYAAAKGGVYGLCRSLSVEGGDHGILVNMVLPMGGPMFSTDGPIPGYERRYPEGLRAAFAPRRMVEAVTPMTLYLASRQCTLTGELFSVGMGRFARVFLGEAPGWTAEDPSSISVQDVAEHLDEIRNLDGFVIPRDIYDEVRAIAGFLGVAPQ
jgi:NAD(P)-dependent dehydrogenase (short-subunit alcohol dehydrogenase family)